jgi:hypothetical protein
MGFSGVIFIPNLIKIHTVELMLVVMAAAVVVLADRQTDRHAQTFLSLPNKENSLKQ